jgi:predicted TIM-barrel fold metal-dependent hydrolase
MIIDFNAYLGPFAFRRLRHNTASTLLKLMDSRAIDKAVVSSAAAITYRNAQAGNEELAEEVKLHRDRLIPHAVVNPAYAGWRDDLKACHEGMGMGGLRIYPKWHRYGLADPICLELVRSATERGMAITIPIRVEDVRQRSWLVDVMDITQEELVGLVKSCPEARFVLLNGTHYERSALGRQGGGLPANYLIEISRLDPLLVGDSERLISNLGADRLVFGTGMPFNYPEPALLNLEVLDASKEDKEKIAWRNAERCLAGKDRIDAGRGSTRYGTES